LPNIYQENSLYFDPQVNEATDIIAENDLKKFSVQIEKEVFPKISIIFRSQMEILDSFLQKDEYKERYSYKNFVSQINQQILAISQEYNRNIQDDSINYNISLEERNGIKWLRSYLLQHSKEVIETDRLGNCTIPPMPDEFVEICNNFFETVELASKFSAWHQDIQKALKNKDMPEYEGPAIRETCRKYPVLTDIKFNNLDRLTKISDSFFSKEDQVYLSEKERHELNTVTQKPLDYYTEGLRKDEILLKADTIKYLRANYPFLLGWYEKESYSFLQNPSTDEYKNFVNDFIIPTYYNKEDGMLSEKGKELFNFLGGKDCHGDESNFKNILLKPEIIYSQLTNQPDDIFFKTEKFFRDQRVLDKAHSIQTKK
jgi:hypothetical protein